MDDDQDTSDDSDDSMDLGAATEQDMAAMMDLESQLRANPYVYDTHVQVCRWSWPATNQPAPPQYITLLRKCKLHERLDAARRAMHDLFPLTEQLWLEWLDDAAETGEGSLAPLFDFAVQDYLSVPIWERYLRYVRANTRVT